jgi:NhaC family Na+:H+ antiporter
LKIISPSVFLFSACIVCAIGAIATGSSWTTGATFGIAFMGIGTALGIPMPMTAGAVISGAYFGDKMSPLSDTTNLASAAAGVDLFTHIRSMIFTSGPAILISLVFYLILGFNYNNANVDLQQLESVDLIMSGIRDNYNLNILCILPPVLVITMALKKFSGITIMAVSSVFGMILSIVVQGYSLGEVLVFMQSGFVSETGVAAVDKLLTRGGLNGMLWTISFAFLALTLGGLLEKTRIIEVVLNKLGRFTKTQGMLILTHAITSMIVSATTASQYMSVVLAGRMYAPAYRKLKIKGEVCSRVCEDTGTIASVMIPWSAGAVYFTGLLGVQTVDYLPFAMFLYLSPAITVFLGFINKFIFKYSDEEYEELMSASE